jgi:hypothetical protein
MTIEHKGRRALRGDGGETVDRRLRHRAYLQAQACDEFQGYLVSKPVPAEDFAAKFLAV